MNWELFGAAAAIGAITELLLLSPEIDIYRRYIAVARVVTVAVVLAAVIPPAANAVALTAFAVPAVGRVVGEWIHQAYLTVRIRREAGSWEHLHQTSDEAASMSATLDATSSGPEAASTT